jgi:hypothetical protein
MWHAAADVAPSAVSRTSETALAALASCCTRCGRWNFQQQRRRELASDFKSVYNVSSSELVSYLESLV